MLKISNKHSINLSIVISILFFVLCVVGAFLIPTLSQLLIDTRSGIGDREVVSEFGSVFIKTIAYLILAVFVAADVLLFKLLLRVKRSLVFTSESVALVRGVSWCCFAVSLLFCLLGLYFCFSFVIGFMGAFLGLCLRITKNVIAEATEIKSENDLTV